MDMPVASRDGYACAEQGCDGVIQATVPLWLDLDADGQWSMHAVGDEAAQIVCDNAEHPNLMRPLRQSLTALLDELFPGCTTQGQDRSAPCRSDAARWTGRVRGRSC